MKHEIHIIDFDEWCETCKYRDLLEREDPCFECLENPINYDSDKPVKFEKAK